MLTFASFIIFLYFTFSQFPYVKGFIDSLDMQVIVLLISALLLNWFLFTYYSVTKYRQISKIKYISESRRKEIGQKYRKALGIVLALEIALVLSIMLIIVIHNKIHYIINIKNIIVSASIGAVIVIIIYSFQLSKRKKIEMGKLE